MTLQPSPAPFGSFNAPHSFADSGSSNLLFPLIEASLPHPLTWPTPIHPLGSPLQGELIVPYTKECCPHPNTHPSTHAAACPHHALRLHHHTQHTSWHHSVSIFPRRCGFLGAEIVLSHSQRADLQHVAWTTGAPRDLHNGCTLHATLQGHTSLLPADPELLPSLLLSAILVSRSGPGIDGRCALSFGWENYHRCF